MIETEKRVREAVRYLGFGKNEADERTLELIQQSFKDLEQEAGPKYICQIFDLNHTEDVAGRRTGCSPDLPGPMGAIVSPKPWNWGAGLPVCLPCPPGMRIPPQCWT